MAHISGNATWSDYPSTATLITAATLEAIENTIDSRPRGVVGRRIRTSNATNAVASAEQMIVWCTAPVLLGRLYKISAPNMSIYGNIANGYTQVNMRITTDGTTVPTTASTQIQQAVAPLPVAFAGYSVDAAVLYAPGSNLTLRVGLGYLGSAGNTVIMQASSSFPITLAIEDVGIDPGNSGADL